MKKRICVIFTGIILLLTSGLWIESRAQEAKDQKSQLTIPWDEFKKLLHLDENEIVISMETFQKILAQTGTTTKPAHTVKEGNVVLTRTEFKKLIDRMKPPTRLDVRCGRPIPHLKERFMYTS